jgi:ABC-type transport system involved in multi-copper enzyme maturation permease subunit
MLVPIIQQELRHAGRRTRLHLLRWGYALLLVVQLVYFLHLAPGFTRLPGVFPFWRLLPAAEDLVRLLLFQQLLVLVLVAPAYTAGAITQEKERGTLQLLLTAGSGTADIVCGKFLARLGEPVLLMLTGVPLICFYIGLRECDWLAALTLGVLPLGPLLGLGAVGVLASVWTRTTREAMLAVYALGLLAALAVWTAGGPLRGLDPLYVLDAAWGEPRERVVLYEDAYTAQTRELVVTYHEAPDLRELATRLLWSLLAWGILAAACLAVAVWRLRPAYLRQLEAPGRGRQGAPVGWRPAMGDDPLHWKERHVEGLAPLAVLRRVPAGLALAALVAGTIVLGAVLLWVHRPSYISFDRALELLGSERWASRSRDPVIAELVLVVMFLALVLTGVRGATAISGERERQTWDGLLLTTLTSQELVEGKLRGIVAAGRSYLVAAGAPILPFALLNGPLPFVLAGFGLVVTWQALSPVAAIGLDTSERFPNSWLSILGTLFIAAAYALLFVAMAPCVLGPTLSVLVFDVGRFSYTRLVPELVIGLIISAVLGVGYNWLFSWFARRYLIRAEKYVELSRPPPLGSERRLGWPAR